MKEKLKTIYDVYTDGACSNNPGPGGYAFVYVTQAGQSLSVNGGSEYTTNNRMELMAIKRALEHIYYERKKAPIKECIVNIYSDSSYCVNPMTEGWIYNWEKSGWKTKSGELVKNVDLWMAIFSFMQLKFMHINFFKVKGHAGNKFNERADALAKEAVKRICSTDKK